MYFGPTNELSAFPADTLLFSEQLILHLLRLVTITLPLVRKLDCGTHILSWDCSATHLAGESPIQRCNFLNGIYRASNQTCIIGFSLQVSSLLNTRIKATTEYIADCRPESPQLKAFTDTRVSTLGSSWNGGPMSNTQPLRQSSYKSLSGQLYR